MARPAANALALLLLWWGWTPEYRNLMVEVMRGSSFTAPNGWQYTTGAGATFNTHGRWFNTIRSLNSYWAAQQAAASGDQ